MKAIVEMSDNERNTYNAIYKNVIALSKYVHWTRYTGYAHYKFEGNYDQELETALGHVPTADEIIIMVDGGYSHFGASCTVNAKDRSFSGRVNTD